MFFKLALLLSVEMFVLTSAIFLLVYITKSQVNKWFTYSVVGIIISILVMMLCSTLGAICMKHCAKKGMQNECRFEDKNCHQGKMFRGMSTDCSHRMMRSNSKCADDRSECEMEEECSNNDACESNQKRIIKKEIIISDEDSLPKKQIIIKKK